jgi:hypothetical protein
MIERVEKLRNTNEKKTFTLVSVEICELCKNPLFSKEGIVYPCGHVIHVECVRKLLAALNRSDKTDAKNECPVCGFVSVEMIDLPFERRTYVDHW